MIPGAPGCGRGGRAWLVRRPVPGCSTSVLGCEVAGWMVRSRPRVVGRSRSTTEIPSCGPAQGQYVGRCSIRRRPVETIRAGTLMIRVHRVAQRARCWAVATAAARAMLNAIVAWATQGGVGCVIPAGQVRQRPVLEFGDDPLDDRVAAVALSASTRPRVLSVMNA